MITYLLLIDFMLLHLLIAQTYSCRANLYRVVFLLVALTFMSTSVIRCIVA